MKTLIQVQTQASAPLVRAWTNRLGTMEQLRRRACLVEFENAAVYRQASCCFLETVQQIDAWLQNPALIERLGPAQYNRLQNQVTYQVIKFGEYLAVLSTSFGQELEDYIFFEEGDFE